MSNKNFIYKKTKLMCIVIFFFDLIIFFLIFSNSKIFLNFHLEKNKPILKRRAKLGPCPTHPHRPGIRLTPCQPGRAFCLDLSSFFMVWDRQWKDENFNYITDEVKYLSQPNIFIRDSNSVVWMNKIIACINQIHHNPTFSHL